VTDTDGDQTANWSAHATRIQLVIDSMDGVTVLLVITV